MAGMYTEKGVENSCTGWR